MNLQKQRQKKLEAKRIREEIQEEKRRQIDLEEAKFQEKKRKEAIERAKTLQYYQDSRVKRLHVSIIIFIAFLIMFIIVYTVGNITFFVSSFT